MVSCQFVTTDRPRFHRCRHCGFTIGPTRFPPERCSRDCDIIPLWEPTDQEQGLGDTVARMVKPIAEFLGIADCGGCNQRREWLNRWWPYTSDEKVPVAKQMAPQVLLRFPHGLGDCVQLTTVLLHLQKLVPRWTIDIASRPGTQSCFTGLCRAAYALGKEPQGSYDIHKTLNWYEPHQCYQDSPATKAERSLREVFNVRPIPELCRYEINPTDQHRSLVEHFRYSLGGRPYVLIHYQGNSAPSRKNFDVRVMHEVVRYITSLGKLPVLLDWNNRSEMLRNDLAEHIINPGNGHWLWGKTACGDAGAIAALAEKADLCIGIDSGPGHIFGAVNAQTLIVWTRHHPLHYFGLADNVTHLVPVNHEPLIRAASDGQRENGARYFRENYQHRIYRRLKEALPATVAEKLVRRDPPLIVDGDCWVRKEYHEPDMVIVRDVHLEDCYRLKELKQCPRYVMDIGAHVGTFARAVRQRSSAAKIACVEANAENLDCLLQNVDRFATVFYGACTYEPGDVTLAGTVYPGTENTGGSRLLTAKAKRPSGGFEIDGYRIEQQTLPKWSLEELVATLEWPRIDLLKLDCEGSEFSILENADLDYLGISIIVGEYHNEGRFQLLARERFANGWKLDIMKDGPMGLFRLRRNKAQARS